MYFLRGHGFDKGGIQDSYYAGLKTTITNLNISRRIFVKINPQVYYLKTDDKDGVYVTNTLSLAIRNFPLSVSPTSLTRLFRRTFPEETLTGM
jgi:hypothetical protein